MYIVSFFFALHIALSAYVSSTFLTQFISEKYVGALYTTSYIIALLVISRSSIVLKHFGNKKLIMSLLLINMASLVGLITSDQSSVVTASFIAFTSTNSLILLCLDIFIEQFGDKEKIGKSRGFYLTITNIAWMISPLITSFLITKEGGYKTIYLLAFIATMIMTVGVVLSVKTFKDKVYQKTPFLEAYKFLKNNKHMLAITIINFLLQFFFAWMVVYTPIYLHNHIGLNWEQIGVIFTMMLAPFVILGLPIGILIDKYHVKKRTLLYIGIVIMIISTAVISFLTTKSIYIWGIILFMTRVGASITETTGEIYFFTHVKEEEEYLLSIYRDMTPVAYIIAPLLATVVFMYSPFKYLFFILSIILIAGLYYIPKLKHNHESAGTLNEPIIIN